MGPVAKVLRSALLLGASVLLAGCGAGLITGIVASGRSGGSGEVSSPELSLTPVLPLVPAPNTTRSVVVANAQIPTSAQLRVTLAALGVSVDQASPVVSGQGGSTAITFGLDTAAIVAAVGDPTAADVEAQLAVLVDGAPIAPAVAVTLVRQPQALLEPGSTPAVFVSPFGQAVTLLVTGLQDVDVANLQMLVETRDPEQRSPEEPGTLTRPCSGLVATATGSPGEAAVTATLPGNAFPDRASVFVRDATSGESTRAVIYYRPEIALALPSQGVTTGGNLVTLIGTALVPHDFTQLPAPLSFADVELSFEKGGRVTTLPRGDFRQELSAGDRLVFRMPASPDGRPDQVDIVLRVQLEGVVARVVASQVFLFANPNPLFGPRGAVLDELPVAVAPIALDGAPGGSDAPDFAVLTEEGGTGFLQLMLAQENGMFLRFGAPRQIGDHEVAAERNPRALCTADFDGDQVPDMFVVNAGGATAVHHLVLGQARPAPPLGAVHRIPAGDPGMVRCVTARIDGDALPDIVLVPGPGAPAGLRPQVLLARPVAIGQPAFALPLTVPVRDFTYDAIAVADLDGDTLVDVAVVDGFELKLDVAFGRGDGTFEPAFELDFTVPGYDPDPASRAVGLHACGNGPLQSLALVLSGDDDGDPTPVVTTLHQPVARQFALPAALDVQTMGSDPVGVSLVADLDGAHSPEFELVAGVRGDPSPGSIVSMGVFRFNGTRFEPIGAGVEIGGELPRAFRVLHYERAFPLTAVPAEGTAIFAVHDSEVDGRRERRLSTLLVIDDGSIPRLLPPDAGDTRPEPVRGIVGGNWSPTAVAGAEIGGVRDLAVARTDGVRVLENDGFGGLPRPSVDLTAVGLLPRTLRLLPAPAGQVERLVFFDDLSRLGDWRPETSEATAVPDHLTGQLRLSSPNPALQAAALLDTTRVEVADVDGDGVDDVVALLRFQLAAPGEGDALLALLRGKSAPLPTESPFHEPTVLLPVHGKATSFALGDFAPVAGGPRQLELALAVPEAASPGGLDGDHVRFFRYVAGATPAEDRFAPSAAPGGPLVLMAGNRPTEVAASDFDRDGRVDLLVAVDGDDTLRLFRNVGLPGGAPGEVEVAAFVEALSSPRALSPGTPVALRLGDVNGDGAIDALVAVQSVVAATNELSTALSFYLSEEPGVFGDASLVSPTRLGDRDAVLSLDTGDWNRDGVLDLFLGWNTAPPNGGRNVRVLFGGSR